MKKILVFVFAAGINMGAFCVDPGGVPGFVVAKFTGAKTLDVTGDISSNMIEITATPNFYPWHFGEYTTIGAKGYMWMEAGVVYSFRSYYYDAYSTIKIDGNTVLAKGKLYGVSTSGSYTPSVTGWHSIDIRVGEENKLSDNYYTSYHGLQWKTSKMSEYERFVDPGDGSVFKTGDLSGVKFQETTPLVISSVIRDSDSTVLDVMYIVYSDEPTVNVRALAFEDGERSFWKVVRPETFIDGTAANIGDGIAANVEHKLSWKVSSDWATELAKVKFEVLVSDVAQLPLQSYEIPAAGPYSRIEFFVGSQKTTDVFNALLWHYADKASDIEIDDGYLYYTGTGLMPKKTLLSYRDSVSDPVANIFNDWLMSVLYCYDKMGLEPLAGPHCKLVRDALRTTIWFNSDIQAAIPKGSAVGDLYVGEKAYLSVDLTTGAETYFDSMPLAGWGDEYKTTKMLFRRIEPGDVRMGDKKPVTITKPYYIGVFEVTQKQWMLVMGLNPSYYKGDMRPVEYVSYSDIRGTSKGAQWPNSEEYDSSSFLGRLEAKTGKKFNLPTESQWEYACRAGTAHFFNNAGNSQLDISVVGRWATNRYDGKGDYSEHTKVGSYLPNAWGLYDMHGNVMEWCLDWYSIINSDPVVDFVGSATGGSRIQRGGHWNTNAYSLDISCSPFASASRSNYSSPSSRSSIVGFRIVMNLL